MTTLTEVTLEELEETQQYLFVEGEGLGEDDMAQACIAGVSCIKNRLEEIGCEATDEPYHYRIYSLDVFGELPLV